MVTLRMLSFSECSLISRHPQGSRLLHRLGELKKPLAVTHNLAGCVFGDPKFMPWLPKSAGEHGFGFIERWCVGNELNEKPLRCAFFMPVDEEGERWMYFGQYLLERMPPVPRSHWPYLHDDVSALKSSVHGSDSSLIEML